MPSAWIEHVKAIYKGGKAGMSYKEAMVKAKASWAKKKAGGKTEKADKPKDEHEEEEHDEKVEQAQAPAGAFLRFLIPHQAC